MIAAAKLHAFTGKQTTQNLTSQLAQITGYDQVIVLRRTAEILKMSAQRFIGSRRHSRAHIVGVLDSGVDDGTDCGAAQERSFPLLP